MRVLLVVSLFFIGGLFFLYQDGNMDIRTDDTTSSLNTSAEVVPKNIHTEVIQAETSTPAHTVPVKGKRDTISPVPNTEATTTVVCTQDAKQCPDGTYVGRVGPHCDFASCPTVATKQEMTCTSDMKKAEMCTAEYEPVCGLVEIQCITTPCNPVPQTFGNACTACMQKNVHTYTNGACGE